MGASNSNSNSTAQERTKHTPTPWTAEPSAAHYEILCGRGAESVPHATQVANVLMIGERREACRANADFIIRACNAHDELVAALRGLIETAEWAVPDTREKGLHGVIADARAALAKAGAA